MKRLWIILASMALTFVLLLVLWAFSRQGHTYTEPQRAILESYLVYKNEYGAEPYTLALHSDGSALISATYPEKFTDQNWLTYSDSNYFTSDFNGNGVYTGGRPVPYPPQDLWCATVLHGETQSMVFVGLHQDMFVAGWIVHEGEHAPYSAEFLAFVESIGCEMK